jgi:hypothetical protein
MLVFVDDPDLVLIAEVGHLPAVDFHAAQAPTTVFVLLLAVCGRLLFEGVGKANGDRAACYDYWFFGHGFASFVAVNEVKGLQLKIA